MFALNVFLFYTFIQCETFCVLWCHCFDISHNFQHCQSGIGPLHDNWNDTEYTLSVEILINNMQLCSRFKFQTFTNGSDFWWMAFIQSFHHSNEWNCFYWNENCASLQTWHLKFKANMSINLNAWWRHQMETLHALLALDERKPPITGGFP